MEGMGDLMKGLGGMDGMGDLMKGMGDLNPKHMPNTMEELNKGKSAESDADVDSMMDKIKSMDSEKAGHDEL